MINSMSPGEGSVPSGSQLERYQGEALSRARQWLDPEYRRRSAVQAARDRDAEALWSLTEAHHTLRGGALGSRHTLRIYRNGLKLWLLFAGQNAVGLLSPRPDEGSMFVRELEAGMLKLSRKRHVAPSEHKPARPLAPASVGAYLAGARALYRALRWAGATQADPFLDVKVVADKVAKWDKRQPYPQSAIMALLSVGDARHRVTVLLGAHAGLRASEMVGLRCADIDLDAGRMKVIGKGRKLRTINISASLRREIAALMAQQPGAALLIGGTPEAARLRLRRACLQAGVPFLSLHALRHSAGTRLVQSGRSLQDVARHLGHASVATAEVYAKWADESLQHELDKW